MGDNPSISLSTTPIVIQLNLSKTSCNSKCPFYALASREDGYEIQKGTHFTSDMNGHGCATITVNVDPKNYFSFQVRHTKIEVALVCAALSVVNSTSVGAKVKVTVSEDGKAVFFITPKKAFEKSTRQQLEAILASLPPKTVS